MQSLKHKPNIVRYEDMDLLDEPPIEALRGAVTIAPPLTEESFTRESNIKPLNAESEKVFHQFIGIKNTPRHNSRASYKLQRLWLTPQFRFVVKKAVPIVMLCLIGFYLAGYRTINGFQTDIEQKWIRMITALQTRPEFMINLVKITGVDAGLDTAVRNAAGVALPQSSLTLDLFSVRQKIEALDTVKSVALVKRVGGILDIIVTPRTPVAVMKDGVALVLLDENGVRSGTIATRRTRLDLPLITGLGAQANLAEARAMLALMAQLSPDLSARILGLARVGERRWDILLDRGQIIQLPQDNAERALAQVIEWQNRANILTRDISIVDMRNLERPIVRLSTPALEDFQTGQAAILGIN